MKKYIKEGLIKYSYQINIKKDGMVICNPTEDMLLENGWVEYVAPTQVEKIEDVRNRKLKEIEFYDNSHSVNEFYINNIPVWVDKATRAGLMLRFQAEIAMGLTETSLWYNSIKFTLALDKAIQMLYAVEVYASNCYDNTQKHLSEVSNLKTIEEIKNYDYRVGYPEKLRFNY